MVMANTFTFPIDTNQRAGAIRVTADGTKFWVPTVIYASDGVTPISKDAPLDTKVVGKTIIDAFSGSANITKTYGTGKTGFMITNDGTSSLTVTINGITFTVKATETFDGVFQPFTSVTVTTTSAYRAWTSE
jgi:hypothetical protein